jgi:hypothetical protein
MAISNDLGARWIVALGVDAWAAGMRVSAHLVGLARDNRAHTAHVYRLMDHPYSKPAVIESYSAKTLTFRFIDTGKPVLIHLTDPATIGACVGILQRLTADESLHLAARQNGPDLRWMIRRLGEDVNCIGAGETPAIALVLAAEWWRANRPTGERL